MSLSTDFKKFKEKVKAFFARVKQWLGGMGGGD